MKPDDPLIPKHGGYRKLKGFQLARLCYDLTVRFCDHYIDHRSRTHDQMVQVARSGVQNIAEGSQVSGTSRKMEMKLTSVARASLEELKLDYEDYLRQRGLNQWERNDPRRAGLIARRPQTEADVAEWAREVHRGPLSGPSGQSEPAVQATESTPTTSSTPSTETAPTYAEIMANAVLAVLAVSTALLDRLLAAQFESFESDGGFTERLYTRRRDRRDET